MTTWVMAATTIDCDAVADEVTVIVRKEGPVTCTGCNKYYEPNKEIRKRMERKSRRLNRNLACEGLECHRVTAYRDSLMAEKTASGESATGE